MTYHIQTDRATVDKAQNIVSAQARAVRYAEEHPGERVWVFRNNDDAWLVAAWNDADGLHVVARDEE